MIKTQPPSLRFSKILIPVISLFLSFSVVAQELPADEESIQEGQTLFQQNCSPCHRVRETLIGPALGGITSRKDLEWVVSFIKNSQKVIASGDEYAVDLYEEYNRLEMPAFTFFTDEQILSIVAYIEDEAQKEPEQPQAAETPAGQDTGVTEPSVASEYLTAILIGLVIVLILILVVLVLIVTVLKRFLSQKELTEEDQEVVHGKISLEAILKHKATIGIVAFIFTALVVRSVIDGLYQVGIQQGYAPVQPVNFSHQLHAGQYQIDCNYCHTGVTKGKNANIPSVNICMNCHHEILKDSPEIQKLYAALEKDTPIEWVRVHNLPDLAYFNHAQHVNVGGIECQTCHGPVEEMAVISQHSSLTMGWCIDCHRTTEVNTRDNAYYDKLVELHEQNGGQPLKVEDIGGTECSKCHY